MNNMFVAIGKLQQIFQMNCGRFYDLKNLLRCDCFLLFGNLSQLLFDFESLKLISFCLQSLKKYSNDK